MIKKVLSEKTRSLTECLHVLGADGKSGVTPKTEMWGMKTRLRFFAIPVDPSEAFFPCAK